MDNNNLIVAIVLSVLILFGFQYVYVKPHQEAIKQHVLAEQERKLEPQKAETAPATMRPRDEVLRDSPRLPILTDRLAGSINLKGARIDDLRLAQYHETVDKGSNGITLLSPSGSDAPHRPYYAEIGWLAAEQGVVVPMADTLWQKVGSNQSLSDKNTVTLRYDNGQGLVFERTIAVDDQFMFTITDKVTNKTKNDVTLYPYGAIARQGNPTTRDGSVVLEGGLGVLSGTLEEFPYEKMAKEGRHHVESHGGWLGFTDKYWLTAFVPQQNETLRVTYGYDGPEKPTAEQGHFQADFRGDAVKVQAGMTIDHSLRFFAGAKVVKVLDGYTDQYDIPHLDKAISFGWFYFLTKPFLYTLDFLGSVSGSYAMAILVFTVLLKLVTLPLSLKSYHSMSRMKELQPEMERIQKTYADDKARQSQEMMALYAREKVNPMSGCMPILIQIPIFFALYKVLYVSIELRQSPFWGWIADMSLPDPTNLFNLFGLVPWAVPAIIPALGAWPVLMGLTMLLQQKLSPQPADKTQARMFMLMPIFFTFLLSHSPAGLVIYWTWSNLLGIVQQWYIMRKDAMRKAAKKV